MADNSVFITGTSSGAFTEAFSDLPPWATEATALQIEKYLRKSFEVQSKTFDAIKKCCMGNGGAGKMSPEDTKKVNDELEKLAKNLKRNNEEDAKQKKRNKDREKDEKESLLRGKKKKDEDNMLLKTLTALSAVGAKVIGVNKDYIDVYDSLYKSGINVMNGNNSTTDGFEVLNQTVNLTGLRLQTLQKVAEKYASTINAVGFTKFAKSLGMANTKLQSLGYSSEEQAELIGTLLDAETGYVTTRNKSADEIARDAIRLGEQFDRLGKTVGMSREQLAENLKATAKSTDSAMIFARFGREAADAVAKNAAGIKDSGLKDMLVELAAATNPAQVKGYNTLVQAGLGDVAQQMAQLSKDMMHLDPVEFQKRIAAMGQTLEQQTGKMGNLANLKGQGGDEAAAALNGLYQQARNVSEASIGQADAARKTEASIARLQTEIESFSATLQKAFFPLTEQVNLAADAFRFLNSNIDKAIASIEAQTRSWIGVGVAIAGLIASLFLGKSAINSFFSVFGKGGNVLAGAVNFLVSPLKFLGNLILDLGPKLGSTVSTITRSAGGIGSILGRIGSFFLRFLGPLAALYAAFEMGRAIGSVLYDTLSSFQWFNDAMDSLFKGIETAADWVVDGVKSIGTRFSEFGSWIYEKLMGVGKWIGSAFDSVLGFVKDIGNKFLSYFPFLKEIGEYFISVKNVVKNIFNELTSFADSFVEVLKTILKKFTSSITFGLVSFDDDEKKKEAPKATATPAKEASKAAPVPVQVVTPAKPPHGMSVPKSPVGTTISSPSTETSNADGSQGNEAMPAGTVASVLPSGIKKPDKNSDINNLLTYQGSLLEQLLQSSNSLVSVNKDILRYVKNSV